MGPLQRCRSSRTILTLLTLSLLTLSLLTLSLFQGDSDIDVGYDLTPLRVGSVGMAGAGKLLSLNRPLSPVAGRGAAHSPRYRG